MEIRSFVWRGHPEGYALWPEPLSGTPIAYVQSCVRVDSPSTSLFVCWVNQPGFPRRNIGAFKDSMDALRHINRELGLIR